MWPFCSNEETDIQVLSIVYDLLSMGSPGEAETCSSGPKSLVFLLQCRIVI